MPLVRLQRHEDDDLVLLFRLQHIIEGTIRYVRAKHTHIVKVNQWFGPRWRGFAGTVNGKDVHLQDRLTVPPFALQRVVSQTSYRRTGDQLMRVDTQRLHDAPSTSRRPYLDEQAHSGLFVWYSGHTAHNDRSALMVYEVERGGEQRAWYAEFQNRDGVWTVSEARGTSVDEIGRLETAYGDRLAPLVEPPREVRLLWEQALDATYASDIAQATVLIDAYRSRHPDHLAIRLLHAKNLVQRRHFEAAEETFRALKPHWPENRQASWLQEWAEFCRIRGDEPGAEAAYREMVGLNPDQTQPWIMLGASLARQGKLQEAEAMHRQATELDGDPDEAYLNLGFIFRATARFEEAAAAFEQALKICPDYPEASEALADVRAALKWQEKI